MLRRIASMTWAKILSQSRTPQERRPLCIFSFLFFLISFILGNQTGDKAKHCLLGKVC